MGKVMPDTNNKEADGWALDQITKSQFFHKKLHDWKLTEIAEQLEKVSGEKVNWTLGEVGISEMAWNKVIHRGIKPIMVFAHPDIIIENPRRISYYRLLSMVSQKSMSNVRLSITKYEGDNSRSIDKDHAKKICSHLNKIISLLVESDKKIDPKELILWRGMAAGSQAQGAWQNVKGDIAEVLIKTMVVQKLFEAGLVNEKIDPENESRIQISDGRLMVLSSEPDIGILQGDIIQIAVEIKGGIDTAGVLERFGATLKSLQRAKKENKNAITVLIMQSISLTKTAKEEIKKSGDIIDYFFTIEDLTDDVNQRTKFFEILKI